jgi:hypothetical protein
MRICEATLESLTPYSQSRYHDTPALNKEAKDDYEARTWRNRLHVDDKGIVYIPPMAFKNAMSDVAKFLSLQIPGKGKATYTKHFEAGLMVMEALSLGLTKDQVEGEWLFVPSDGKRGGGSRVKRCFPVIRKWSGTVKFYVLDDTITEEVFEHHLREAGNFIGLGRFRPRNNGFYGRFKVIRVKWPKE